MKGILDKSRHKLCLQSQIKTISQIVLKSILFKKQRECMYKEKKEAF